MYQSYKQFKKRALQYMFNRTFRPRLQEFCAPAYAALLDYPPQPDSDWGGEKGPHAQLYEVTERNRASYSDLISGFVGFTDSLLRISDEPNGFFDALDAIALYCLIATRRPRFYIEIGSGNSTKFARRAINDFQLATRIISVDPHPRAEIDALCDEVVRVPVQKAGRAFFDRVGSGDFVFFDGSHRTFTNSDCTFFFLDVIPRLQSGVVVHIHDIFIPYEYPLGWAKQYYSEQYLLAAWLLGGGFRLRILLPNAFVSRDPQLLALASNLFEDSRIWQRGGYLKETVYLGSSFWCEIQVPKKSLER